MDHELFQDEREWIGSPRADDFPAVSLVRGDGGWEPDMSEKQADFYWDGSHYVFAHGERLTGKTTIAIDKILRHCYQHDGALAMIVVKYKSGAKGGGIWEQLLSEEFDHRGEPWGNLAKWSKHVGLRRTVEYGDDAKNKWVDIETKNSGSSSILLLSLNVAAHIKAKVRDYKPSMFHFEELQEADSSDYFTFPIQQLRRRASVPVAAQQYTATLNPPEQGEKSWQFKTIFVHKKTDPRGFPLKSFDPKGYNPYTKKKEGWDKRFGAHHLPSQDNIWAEDVEGYQQSIIEQTKNDPTEYDRQILGKWTAKVAGNSIFAYNYNPEIHLRGKIGVSGLLPIVGHSIIVGHDPGDVNNAKAMLQRIRSQRRWWWRAVDCISDLSAKISYDDHVRMLYDRKLWWCKRMGHVFDFEHIGDQAAMNAYNPQGGSYDYQAFEKISRKLIAEEERFAGLSPIIMKAPEKGAGSVGERVRCVQQCLNSERLLVSAKAEAIDDMFRFLMKAKDRAGNEDDYKPLKTKLGHIHMFDAVSYPIYYYESNELFDHQIEEEQDLMCGTFS